MEQRYNLQNGKKSKKMHINEFISKGKIQIISTFFGFLIIKYREHPIVTQFFKCIGIKNYDVLKDQELFSVCFFLK